MAASINALNTARSSRVASLWRNSDRGSGIGPCGVRATLASRPLRTGFRLGNQNATASTSGSRLMNAGSTEPAPAPKLMRLVGVDVHRDGGSYSAAFATANGAIYSIWLQRSRMPDSDGLHHRWLFEYFGEER